jgi:hypothetical protein
MLTAVDHTSDYNRPVSNNTWNLELQLQNLLSGQVYIDHDYFTQNY